MSHANHTIRNLAGILCLLIELLLQGCGQKSTRKDVTTTSDSVAVTSATQIAKSDTMCFRQVTGRDTTTLRLYLKDSVATGELVVLPFEKDQARGLIHGILANNQIMAEWQRSGEGIIQPYEVVFTLKGDAVTWREGERVEKSGKWVLKKTEQSYEYVLMKVDCQ